MRAHSLPLFSVALHAPSPRDSATSTACCIPRHHQQDHQPLTSPSSKPPSALRRALSILEVLSLLTFARASLPQSQYPWHSTTACYCSMNAALADPEECARIVLAAGHAPLAESIWPVLVLFEHHDTSSCALCTNMSCSTARAARTPSASVRNARMRRVHLCTWHRSRHRCARARGRSSPNAQSVMSWTQRAERNPTP
jgi:hypothetical protein